MRQIFIINGPARSGKDTFIHLCRKALKDKDIPVYSFSSVDEVKQVLKDEHGWDGVTKDEHWRNEMVKLKAEMIADNDRPTHFLLEKIEEVENGLIFLHIREAEEIEKIIKLMPEIQTIHMERPQAEKINTTADTKTKEYAKYDFELVNDFENLEEMGLWVRGIVGQLVRETGRQ